MKSFFVLAAAATLAVVNGAACDLIVLAPLLQDTDVKKCSADTGFQPPLKPTAEQLPKLCPNTACQAALGKLKALNLGDCTVGTIALQTDLIGPIETYCESLKTTAPTSAPTTGPTTAPGTPSTTAPAGTPTVAPTTKPSC